MADNKKPVEALDASPAESAAELARLRARVAELEARPVPDVMSGSISDAPEHDAGIEMVDVENKDGTTGLKEKQMWWLRIELPPSGGVDVKINGRAYYHGQTYKIDTDTLRTLKDVIARTWKHEESIKGSNENFYRRPQERVLRGEARR